MGGLSSGSGGCMWKSQAPLLTEMGPQNPPPRTCRVKDIFNNGRMILEGIVPLFSIFITHFFNKMAYYNKVGELDITKIDKNNNSRSKSEEKLL